MTHVVEVSLPDSVDEKGLQTACVAALALACNTVMQEDLRSNARPERWYVNFQVGPDVPWHDSQKICASTRYQLVAGKEYEAGEGMFSREEAWRLVTEHCWDKIVRAIVAALVVVAGEEKSVKRGNTLQEELELMISVYPIVDNSFAETVYGRDVQRHAFVKLSEFGVEVASE